MNYRLLAAKLPLYLALLTLSQCSSCDKNDPAPIDQLPPATQTGANTFGCLVNGQPWSSKTSTAYGDYVFQYESGITQPIGGNLNITLASEKGRQTIHLGIGPIFQARTYVLSVSRAEGAASYSNKDAQALCNSILYFDAPYLSGSLTLTRVDEQAGIVAGTFEFKLAKPGCDTIRVTQGRFDHKI